MAAITGKTVYVFGAGASVHAGAPLLRDFLQRARLLLDHPDGLVYRKSFVRVFKWIEELRSSSYYVEIDLANLEHVFSLAEMAVQVGRDNAEEIYSDLKYLAVETLDFCDLRLSPDKTLMYEPPSVYSQFVRVLNSRNKSRRDRIGSDRFRRDSIISFNYDVMLDYAIRFHRVIVKSGV